MIIYTPEYPQPSTGTNEWGSEVQVIGGEVATEPGGNDLTIPEDGFVLSGHGTAASWINANLEPGTPVQIAGGKVKLGPPQSTNPWIEYWHATAAVHQRGGDTEEIAQLREILNMLQKAQEAEGPKSQELQAEALRIIRELNPGRYE